MPYVPPHLREGRADSAPPPSSSFGRSKPSSNGPVSRDYGSSFGSRRGDDRSNGAPFGGTGGSKDTPLPSRDSGRRPAGPPEVVWEEWKPSQRVLDLTPEQIEEVRKRLNIDVQVTPGTPSAPAAVESFGDIGLNADIMKDITFHSYTNPTPIQAQAMPVALSGRDLLGCAETGSGKTAAFAIPMIQHCRAQPPVKRGDGPLALVLAPTRELAQQIEKEVRAFTRSSKGFKSSIVVGGTHMGDQASELRGGVELVVATPGRFIDHLHQGNTDLRRISYVVLDEADRMLDMGFEPQIREVMKGIPTRHQTLLFSATMPQEIEALAQEYLDKPVRVKVGTVSSPTANVTQSLEKIPEPQKLETLLSLLVEESDAAESNQQPQPLTIVFVERKTKCDEVADALTAQGLRAVAIHGGRSQGEREAALRDFRKGERNILVATDVASRGLDVSGVAHVINMDLPKTLEDYVHRIGRTGRAGASGRATSFHTERDAYLVAQIKRALSEIEAGNTMAFATGKAARAKEREAAMAAKSGPPTAGASIVSVDDKFRHMLALSTTGKDKDKGVADDAWDD